MSSDKGQFEQGYRPDVIQQDTLPGKECRMEQPPEYLKQADGRKYKPAEKLVDKIALITGGDSGIGRSIAVLFAMEGADLVLCYYPNEEKDAQDTKTIISVEAPHRKCHLIAKDISVEENCEAIVDEAIKVYGRIDILVHNAATQKEVEHISDLPSDQWRHVMDVNINAIFYITKRALPHIPEGGSIIFNASINPFIGHPGLLDYTTTKGAIVAFSRSLSNQIVSEKKIRVNTVCPGPIVTPLVYATMTKESLEKFGITTPIGRPGQPVECATCFVFLASNDSSYISGQCIHVNGGSVIA
ncbi:Reductases with broad range of substrate specificities [Phaffia rhodozyma]|uniref:Reductases with broad range of substrate specificities n=1 Tax=Phaffia rhodozyma TaxID=264483 RepID=A0A0F7SS42_PHARH|nr:Reductases with broad range of substrate specificities [Phaffia rhodozyma]